MVGVEGKHQEQILLFALVRAELCQLSWSVTSSRRIMSSVLARLAELLAQFDINQYKWGNLKIMETCNTGPGIQ